MKRPLLLALLLAGACREDVDPRVGEAPLPSAGSPVSGAEVGPYEIEKSDGLVVRILEDGNGRRIRRGDRVTIHYVSRVAGSENAFGSSRSSGIPFTFELRAGVVIDGLVLGLDGLRVGTRCVLEIPGALAYGDDGLEHAGVPPGADLAYEVQVLDTRRRP